VSSGVVGINALNLRNLGENRHWSFWMVSELQPPRSLVSSTSTSFLRPWLKRVDVVTGGASADWGSDAVAGVINFVLDKDFTGLKADVQGGQTTYGDDRTPKVSLTGGSGFADGRGIF